MKNSEILDLIDMYINCKSLSNNTKNMLISDLLSK